jgi:hypothetical protein
MMRQFQAVRALKISAQVLTRVFLPASLHTVNLYDLSGDFSDGSAGGTNPSAPGWNYYANSSVTFGSWGDYYKRENLR